MTNLDDLITAANLVPAPQPLDWAAAEEAWGARVPPDFRTLLDAGGAGLWFGYIRLHPPVGPFQDLNLVDAVGIFEDLRVLWDDDPERSPGDLDPESRLLAWGSTPLGERLYWRVDPGVDPGEYPIYIEDSFGDEWERHDLSVTDFLAGILRAEISSEFFAESYLDTTKPLAPYPDADEIA